MRVAWRHCCPTTHSTGARDSIPFDAALFHNLVCLILLFLLLALPVCSPVGGTHQRPAATVLRLEDIRDAHGRTTVNYDGESAASLIALAFCRPASAGQSAAPEGWRKIGTDETISFLLPEDMKQTDTAGVEDVVLEYTNGRMRLVIVLRPWGVLAQREGRRRSRHMKGYREKETRIDGRRAYVQTFYTDQKGAGRAYRAELTVVTRDWARGVELRATFTGSDASDLRVAERIFASFHLPTERGAPNNGMHPPPLDIDTAPRP